MMSQSPRTHTVVHRALATAGLFCLLAGGVGAARAADPVEEQLRQLRQEAQRLMERIEALERLQSGQRVAAGHDAAPPAATAPAGRDGIARPAPGGAAPAALRGEAATREKRPMEASDVALPTGKGILELSSGDTTLSIGGLIQLESGFSWPSKGAALGDLTLTVDTIPTNGGGENGQWAFSARSSRLWVKTRAPTPYGKLNTLIEMDFKGSPGDERVLNAHNPRLRHAYAEFGGFTFGQTSTTFMNLGAFPDHYNDVVGIVNVRQPMIRWSHPFPGWELHLAAEQPETVVSNSAGARVTPDDDRLPDLVGKVVWQGPWGQASLSGLGRLIRDDGAVVAGSEDEALGGALYLAGRIKAGGQDNLRFGLAGGNALGRYIAYNAFNDGQVDAGGHLSLTPLYGGHLSYQHWWREEWRSSLTLSHIQAGNDLGVVPGSVTRSGDSLHLNLIWSPLLRTSFGLEFVHASRELENGQESTLDRIHFSANLKF